MTGNIAYRIHSLKKKFYMSKQFLPFSEGAKKISKPEITRTK